MIPPIDGLLVRVFSLTEQERKLMELLPRAERVLPSYKTELFQTGYEGMIVDINLLLLGYSGGRFLGYFKRRLEELEKQELSH